MSGFQPAAAAVLKKERKEKKRVGRKREEGKEKGCQFAEREQ